MAQPKYNSINYLNFATKDQPKEGKLNSINFIFSNFFVSLIHAVIHPSLIFFLQCKKIPILCFCLAAFSPTGIFWRFHCTRSARNLSGIRSLYNLVSRVGLKKMVTFAFFHQFYNASATHFLHTSFSISQSRNRIQDSIFSINVLFSCVHCSYMKLRDLNGLSFVILVPFPSMPVDLLSDYLQDSIFAINVFISWLKIFKYISFNKTMNTLSDTLIRLYILYIYGYIYSTDTCYIL